MLVGALALTFAARRTDDRPRDSRESLFTNLLPAEASEAAKLYEASGAMLLDRRFTELETRYPLQILFFDQDGAEVLGRPAPDSARHMARLALQQDLTYVIVNIAGRRAAGPSGKLYATVFLQEPGPRYRIENQKALVRLFGVELPIMLVLGSGLFCYLTARHVTRPIVALRTAAEGIAEGRLETRMDPRWGKRKDEIGELGRDFDRMAGRIESLVAGQKRLLGDVSHELRSPLSRLMVALELLKSRPKEEAAELIGRIGSEARRLDKLIGQLLTLARIDSGVQADPQPFDLANLVEEVARDAGFEAGTRGCKVAVTRVDACSMAGSEELIRSAVENVVRNAVRHTGEGTQVDVALERREDRAIVKVRDHGPGVRERALEEIFIPFRKIDSKDGAGLGLAIVDRAVRMHGGSVRASNAPEGGLAVEIELPTAGAGH